VTRLGAALLPLAVTVVLAGCGDSADTTAPAEPGGAETRALGDARAMIDARQDAPMDSASPSPSAGPSKDQDQ
jgi:nitrous oxide reductase accessory protein NosL